MKNFNKFKGEVQKLCSSMVKEYASQFSKSLMTQGTFPISNQTKNAKGTITNKNMMSSKGMGKTVERDVRRTAISEKSIAFSPIVPFETQKILKGMHAENKKNPKGNYKSRVRKIASTTGLKNWSVPEHESHRVNGKIPKTHIAKAYTLTPSIYNKHVKEKKSHVGNAKSGWIGPPNSWYSKVPKWLKRPQNGQFYHKNLTARIVNKVPYIQDAMMMQGAEENAEQYAQKIVSQMKNFSKFLKK